MQAAISISSAENEPESSGESATGRISWGFRTPPGSTRTEIWLWPDNHKDGATRLGGELRDLLDTKAREILQLEEHEWLKKRDAIKSLQEKVECTVARVDTLKARISKLDR
jgi:hypothetical protein